MDTISGARLKVLLAVLMGDRSARAIRRRTGLSMRKVLWALPRLAAAGLLCWDLRPGTLRPACRLDLVPAPGKELRHA